MARKRRETLTVDLGPIKTLLDNEINSLCLTRKTVVIAGILAVLNASDSLRADMLAKAAQYSKKRLKTAL